MGEVIGLTGGIATGKSTVARMFIEAGIPVIDTDVLAHEVEQQRDVQNEIMMHFGSESVKNGQVQRRYLAKIVFADAKKREVLNALIHPLVKQKLIQQLKMNQAPFIVVDVPLMYETDYYQLMDFIIVVYAEEALQVERLQKRNHLTEAEALARIRSQMPIAEKVRKADYVLDNTQSESVLKEQFEKLLEELCVRAEEEKEKQ